MERAIRRYQALIKENWDDLARSIVYVRCHSLSVLAYDTLHLHRLEQGKTFADAKGDVLRGLQVSRLHRSFPARLTLDLRAPFSNRLSSPCARCPVCW
jgi:hypothetical protein